MLLFTPYSAPPAAALSAQAAVHAPATEKIGSAYSAAYARPTAAGASVTEKIGDAYRAVYVNPAAGTQTPSLSPHAVSPKATASLMSVTASPSTVVAGQSTTLTVTLSAAPSQNATVALSSSNTNVAPVPANFTVPAGSTTGTTQLTTSSNVSANTTVTISAAYAGVTQTASLTVLSGPPPPPNFNTATRFDFNSDGHSDLVWYNTGSGAVSVWDMNDTAVLSYGGAFAQLAPSSGWQPVAAPDVSNDGVPDLIWWNSQTGELSAWTLAAGSPPSVTRYGADFATLSDTTWKPVAAADVTGTTWELVFQNSATGNLSAWQMNGTTVTSYGGTLGSVGAGTGWQCVGAPDLDGDGRSDLLFWNSGTGAVSWWGCNLAGSQPAVLSYHGSFTQVSDTSWHLQGSEDTNGDGHPDLVWWNANTGAESRWLLSGTTVTQYGGTDTQVADTTWQPTALR